MEQNPELKLSDVGHTDAPENADYNMDLLWQRTESVVEFLISGWFSDNPVIGITKRFLNPWFPQITFHQLHRVVYPFQVNDPELVGNQILP